MQDWRKDQIFRTLGVKPGEPFGVSGDYREYIVYDDCTTNYYQSKIMYLLANAQHIEKGIRKTW